MESKLCFVYKFVQEYVVEKEGTLKEINDLLERGCEVYYEPMSNMKIGVMNANYRSGKLSLKDGTVIKGFFPNEVLRFYYKENKK